MLDAASYEFVRTLVRSRAGMVLDADKDYLIEARLEPLAREEKFSGLDALVRKLRLGADERLIQRVVDAMMVHETSFFRDTHPFDMLREQVLPDLIKRRRDGQRLDIWCAASSSGQEPYSVAMTLVQHFPELADWTVRIHASDISQRMLERIKEGVYAKLEVDRGLSPEALRRFFSPRGSEWVVKEELRRWIHPFRINLIEPWPFLPRMDIVFMRNVLIYFDVSEKRSILTRLQQIVQPDGYLFLGSAETTLQISEIFEPLPSGRGLCYQQRAG